MTDGILNGADTLPLTAGAIQTPAKTWRDKFVHKVFKRGRLKLFPRKFLIVLGTLHTNCLRKHYKSFVQK